jgi:hypothetical protein
MAPTDDSRFFSNVLELVAVALVLALARFAEEEIAT